MSRRVLYPWTTWIVWAPGVPLGLVVLGFVVVAGTDPETVVFDAPHLWWLGAVGPVAGLIVLWSVWQRRRALERFTSAELAPLLAGNLAPGRQAMRRFLFIAALLMIAGAVIGPRWGLYVEQRDVYGVDIAVALDVSRSMLAEDVAPNRMERAKREIWQQLTERPVFGDTNRMGLIAFAGSTSLKAPLSTDRLSFREKLAAVDVGSAPRGGTAIARAIMRATDLFVASPEEATRLILVFTDGEDHEGDPVVAAQTAYEEHGIRTYTVGVGDPSRTVGVQIPGPDGRPLLHEGQIVFSKLDVAGMRKIAEAGHGRFAPVTELHRLVDAIADMHEAKLGSEERIRHRPRYQWFVAAALLLLAMETVIGERRAKMNGDYRMANDEWPMADAN